jgi:flagellar basal-body rod protein FlgC
MKILFFLFVSILIISCQKESPEDFFAKLNILTLKKQIILNNILNIKTTRTAEGGPYIPKEARACKDGGCTIKALPSFGVGAHPTGPREPILKYEPGHPDALNNGYVAYPNINLDEERQKLNKVNTAIKFLLKEMPVSHSFFFSKEAAPIFSKFKAIDGEYNFKKLLEE